MLNDYGEFIAYVEEKGVVAFYGKFLEGFPRLQDITGPEQWHTGDAQSDPWQWKDRAAAEKRLAFGCVLGGSKGFIAKRLYPLFYAACRPEKTKEEAYEDGLVSVMEMNLYKLFGQQNAVLSTADIRGLLGVTKETSSKADQAIVKLQKEFYITVCGNKRKTGKDGQEYGWPANTYCRVEDWLGDWIKGHEKWEQQQAREEIVKLCKLMGASESPGKIAKKLF